MESPGGSPRASPAADAGAAALDTSTASPHRSGALAQETGGEERDGGEDAEQSRREDGMSDFGEDYDDDGARKKKNKKKKKRHHSEDDDAREPSPEPVLPSDPAEARMRELDRQIMAAAKPRSFKRPRRKNADEIDLDQAADEEVVRLRDAMIAAADEDELANAERRPATSKLRMLKEVVDTLQKVQLQQSFSDNDILSGVKRFLEPLPDKSLPSLSIQRQLLPILEKMDIDATMLKMSGLGKVMLFYSRCGRVEPGMRRIADRLIENWSRPILQRYASYRRRALETREFDASQLRRYDQELPQSQQAGSQGSRPRVQIPEAIHGESFRYLPESRIVESQDASHLARRANHVKLNHFKRTLKEKKTR